MVLHCPHALFAMVCEAIPTDEVWLVLDLIIILHNMYISL